MTAIFKQFADFCHIFNLTNLVNAKTCLSQPRQFSLDVILTNRPKSFQKTAAITTGLNYHKVISLLLDHHIRANHREISSVEIKKILMPKIFLNDLESNGNLEEQTSTCVSY